MRTVSLIGSSGSIGTQALDVLRGEPGRFRVLALAAHRSAQLLVAQAAEFRPDLVVIGDPALYRAVRDAVPAGTQVMTGEDGFVAAAREADVVLNAVVGFAGLPVTMAALEAGKRLALANKESLIAGAPVVRSPTRWPIRPGRWGRRSRSTRRRS
jgi:1-deoxy-D-xylulose-5-phosphate reductoisomerase